MANDEALPLYGAVKRLAEAMTVREKVLEGQMAELDTKTAELDLKTAALPAHRRDQQLPRALGQQTSQYIAAGVRETIREDFSLPLAKAVEGPYRAVCLRDRSRAWGHQRDPS